MLGRRGEVVGWVMAMVMWTEGSRRGCAMVGVWYGGAAPAVGGEMVVG